MLPEYSAVLLRYGEIGIKSRQTRRRMVSLLVKHVETALKEAGVSFSRIRTDFGRVYVETTEAVKVSQVASRVFGIVSTSPVVVTASNLDTILDVGSAMAVASFTEGRSFAVRASRVGTHAYSSPDIRERLGERILEKLANFELKVDLKSPAQVVEVEVRDEMAYIFTETVPGVGGMPMGSQGKVVCLISSGLDSPVAAYKAMKRGCIPVFVTFDDSPYANEACSGVAVKQAAKLAEYVHDYQVKIYVVPHGADLADIVSHAPYRMTCLYCKRNMLRMAREIAVLENADALVTGEIIGEQASQTSRNLRAIGGVVCDYPVLRPCIGDDKVDVEHLAAAIGTYQFASEGLSCCTLPPKYPMVRADIDKVSEAEQGLDLSILKTQVSQAKVVILKEKS